MLRLVLPEGAEIDTREFDRGGTSFMIDTLASLRAEINPDVPLRLLIGIDQMEAFDRWHRWREILDLAPPAVMVRPGPDVQTTLSEIADRCGPDVASRWCDWILDLPLLDASSTRARADLGGGSNPESDVSPEVVAYIQANHLYQRQYPPLRL